jgi:hypothetical protein
VAKRLFNDKPFDKKESDNCDPKCKVVGTELLTQLGFLDIEENLGESHGDFSGIWDIRGTHPEFGEWRFDVELKKDWGTVWLEQPFRYSTVDIPFRKRDKAEVHATHHVVIGGDLERLFIVKRSVVLSSTVGYKMCRNRSAPEPFYKVRVENGMFVVKKADKWVPYKEKNVQPSLN